MKQLVIVMLVSLSTSVLAGGWEYSSEANPTTGMTRHVVRWNADDATLSLLCDSGLGERREVRLWLVVAAAIEHPLADVFIKIDDAEPTSVGVWYVRSSSHARTVTEAQQAILLVRKLDHARTLGLQVVTTEGPLTFRFDLGDLASAKERLKPHCIVEYPIR